MILRPTTSRPLWILGGILVIAALLRAASLTFGLPAVFNPDEVAIMNRAMALGQNAFNPHNFLYPSLYFYALFTWEGLWFLVGRATGMFGSLADFERMFFVDPSSIYLAGRIFSVVCGVATVWLTALFGKRLFGARAGWLAAALLAVAPLAVRDAHYVKHDVPVTLLIVLAHWLAACARDTPSRLRWVLTAIAAGLAMSTHYYAVFVMAPILLLGAAPATEGESLAARVTRVLLVGAVATLAFLAASPFLLVEPATAFGDIVANRQIVVDRATTSGGLFGSLPYYLAWLVRDGIGVLAALLGGVGLLLIMSRGWQRLVLTTLFPGLLLLFIANTVPASRYLNAVVPFVAVAAGAAVSWMLGQRRVLRVGATLLFVGACVEGGLASLATDRFLAQKDTRTLAAEWIASQIPAGASILVQPYSVALRPSREGLVEALTANLGDPSRASIKFQRQLALEPYPAPAYRTIYLGTGGLDADKIYIDPAAFETGTLAPLRERAVTYVVMKRYNVEDPSMVSIGRALEREGRLVMTFSPYSSNAEPSERLETPPFLHNTDVRMARALARPGPIIEIWRVN